MEAFTNRCVRNILGVRWPNTISNEDLLAKNQEEKMMTQIRRKKWRTIGHTPRKPHDNVTKKALFWNPQGKRNRGRPKNNWRRSAEQELQQIGLQWIQIDRQARPGQKPVENNCERPMLHLGSKSLYIQIEIACFTRHCAGISNKLISRALQIAYR